MTQLTGGIDPACDENVGCNTAAGMEATLEETKPRATRRVSQSFDTATRTRLLVVAALMVPVVVRANPVSIDGQSLIAFAIVAFWALVIESGIATLALVSSGVLIVPSFGTLILANVALFLFAFLPLTSRVSLWILEPGVVLGDALLLKFVAATPFLQGSGFVGVSWRRALVASVLGNAASFFVGVLASGAPWITHETGRLE